MTAIYLSPGTYFSNTLAPRTLLMLWYLPKIPGVTMDSAVWLEAVGISEK